MLLSHLKISGHSMEPSILNGQSVLASSIPFLFDRPKIGDIVIIRQTNHQYTSILVVKRISKIKAGKFYVLGDNKSDSNDSRKFGWVGRKDIAGKVILIL